MDFSTKKLTGVSNGSHVRFPALPAADTDHLWGRADVHMQAYTPIRLFFTNKICADCVKPARKYTDQLRVRSRVSLIILLLRNPYGIVYFWKWPHTYTHGLNIHGRRRSARSTSRPQSPCYSQNDDIATAISISDLEPGYLKPTRQLPCKSLFWTPFTSCFHTHKQTRENKWIEDNTLQENLLQIRITWPRCWSALIQI